MKKNNRILFLGSVFLLANSLLSWAQPLTLVNPGFEDGGSQSYFNGPFSFNGWEGNNRAFISVGVKNGGSEGSKHMVMGYGGWIKTAPNSRPSAQPGRLYRLTFDMVVTENTIDYVGSVAEIEFYDGSGNKLQSTKTVELEDRVGTSPYQTFSHYAVSPAGTASIGIRYESPRSSGGTNDIRKTAVDHFRMVEMQEEDKVAFRIAPRLIEPGKTKTLEIKYGVTTNREIAVRLLRGSTLVGSEARTSVSKGRGIKSINYSVPSNASTASNYKWQIRVLPSGGSWSSSLNSIEVTGAFLNESVSGSGSASPNNSRIQYIGRWKDSGSNAPVCYWVGSAIRARFNGTSIQATFRNVDNKEDISFVAIIDGKENDADRVKFTVPKNQTRTFTLATGLSNTTHTIEIHRQGVNRGGVRFDGFVFSSGKGLLVSEPITRRFEVYGDSITAGANAGLPKITNPNPSEDADYFSSAYDMYAARTARALGGHQSVIAQGGIGLTGSFTSGGPNMREVWNMVNFTGFNDSSSSGAVLWDFSQFQPDVIVIGIGHNDQFFQTSQWASAYSGFVSDLRNVYPNAHIFCTNTTMSNSHNFWQRAVEPLAAANPKVHYQYFMPYQGHGGHPKTLDHIAMATGERGEVVTTREWGPGLIEWIEETMGWGIGFGVEPSGGGGSGGGGNFPNIESVSEQASGTPASNLLDGDTSGGSRWSANGFPQNVVIDYGESKTISGTRLWTYQNRAYRYTVAVSNNSTSGFTMVVDRSNNTSSSQPITNNFSAVTGRYVRITVTGASGYSGPWVSLREFEIIEGSGGGGGTFPNIESVSNQQSSNPASNLLDGNTNDSSRWSAQGFPQSVIIDNGPSPAAYNQIKVWTYQNRAYQYQIWGSDNLASVQNEDPSKLRVDRSNNTSSGQPITDTTSGYPWRYLKIKFTGASGYSGSWVSITEIETTN